MVLVSHLYVCAEDWMWPSWYLSLLPSLRHECHPGCKCSLVCFSSTVSSVSSGGSTGWNLVHPYVSVGPRLNPRIPQGPDDLCLWKLPECLMFSIQVLSWDRRPLLEVISVKEFGYWRVMCWQIVRHCERVELASYFLTSSARTRTICLLLSGVGLLPFEMAVWISFAILSHEICHVSGHVVLDDCLDHAVIAVVKSLKEMKSWMVRM